MTSESSILFTFSDNLTKIRKKRGLYQREVAEALGIQVAVYCHWENCHAIPNTKNMAKLCNFFREDISYFFTKHKETL